MSLIDRYVHEVGRFIPRKKRNDIQVELRSSLVDSLEDRYGPNATEAQIEELLKEFGRPRAVAASYHPQGQYLIGPVLYPLFRMVAWIVVAAVLGAQALAWSVAVFFAGEQLQVLNLLASVIYSVPMSLGWVVFVFMILQYFDAKPHLDQQPWDPQDLPEINPDQDLKRGEMAISMVVNILLLVLVTFFPQWVGFVVSPGRHFYANPVILDYLVWIQAGLIVGILLNIYLFWKGRLDLVSRGLKLAVSGYVIAVLALLVQGHNAWLADRSSGAFTDFFTAIEALDWQLVGMHAFRWGFAIALIISVIELLVAVYRLVRSRMDTDISPGDNVLEV